MATVTKNEGFSAVAFMPYLRPGDSIQTAISYYQRLNFATAGRSRERIRGSKMSLSGGLGSLECREVAKRMYGDEKVASRLLYENSLFGALSRGMSTSAQELTSAACVDKSVQGTSNRQLYSFWIRLRSLALKDLRSCTQCVDSDNEDRGFASWRVLHQLNQVDCCVHHGNRLCIEVEASGGSSKRLSYADLPSGRRGKFVSCPQAPIHSTAGYSQYLKAWERAFIGDLPQIAIDHWTNQLAEAKAIVGGEDELAALVRDNLETEWESSLRDIASTLRIEGGENFLTQELAFITHPGCIARRLIVQGALEQLSINFELGDRNRQQEFHFFDQTTRAGDRCGESAELRLQRAILDSGYYPSVWSALKSRVSQAEVVKISGASKQTISWIIRAMPTDILDELNADGEWPCESWLVAALKKRSSRGTQSRSKKNRDQTEVNLYTSHRKP